VQQLATNNFFNQIGNGMSGYFFGDMSNLITGYYAADLPSA
jgi:hypothetical protein